MESVNFVLYLLLYVADVGSSPHCPCPREFIKFVEFIKDCHEVIWLYKVKLGLQVTVGLVVGRHITTFSRLFKNDFPLTEETILIEV